MPLEQLSHYRLIRKLGSGGMGEVYLGQDLKLNRYVALKVLPAEFVADEERVERLEQEARAASALNHPNVLTIYEIGSHESHHFIATEFIDGVTLRERVNTPMSVAEIVDIAVGITSALVAAHEAWLIHRDIKPENVMIRRDGVVKVLDFGLAKLNEKNFSVSQPERKFHTTEGFVKGTVHYMSPEQLRGGSIDSRTDLFSLGVVLYEMLSGAPPFAGPSSNEIIAGILERTVPPIVTREIPPPLARLVMNLLEKNANDRPGSAAAVLEELKTIRYEMEPGARSSSRGRPAVLSDTGAFRSQPTATLPLAGTTDSRRAALSRSQFLGIAVTAVLVATGALFFGRAGRLGGSVESLAVMPFESIAASAETAYLSEGVTESLIRRLSKLPGVQVMARSTVSQYRNKPVDPRAVGRELGVDAVLIGRLQYNNGKISIETELVDTNKGTQLWSERYVRESAGLIGLEDEMAQEIARNLRPRLSGQQQAVLRKHETESLEAYHHYLRGRHFLNKRTNENYQKAIEYFQKAIEQDPTYALAYAGIADSYNLLGSYSDLSPGDSFQKAKSAAQRALAIDETLAEAHASLAYAKQNYEWDWSGAEREYRRAIELDPTYPMAYHWFGGHLLLMGRFDEGLKTRQRAQELDPLSPIISLGLAAPHIMGRRYDQAIAQYRKTLELDPNFSVAYTGIGWSHVYKGEYQKAIAAFDEVVRLTKADREMSPDIAYAYAASGDRERAGKIVNAMISSTSTRYISPYDIALVYVALGDADQAFAWLEKAYAQRSNRLIAMKVIPSLDPIRKDPRFDEFLRRMKL